MFGRRQWVFYFWALAVAVLHFYGKGLPHGRENIIGEHLHGSGVLLFTYFDSLSWDPTVLHQTTFQHLLLTTWSCYTLFLSVVIQKSFPCIQFVLLDCVIGIPHSAAWSCKNPLQFIEGLYYCMLLWSPHDVAVRVLNLDGHRTQIHLRLPRPPMRSSNDSWRIFQLPVEVTMYYSEMSLRFLGHEG